MLDYYIETLPDDEAKGTTSKIMDRIPYTKIPYTQEFHPHVTNIACYVIRYNDKFCAEWLLNHIEKDGAIWNNFKFPWYKDFPEKWVGGLGQGLAISALIRQYRRTKDVRYLEGAEKVFLGLKKYCIRYDGAICEYPGHYTILNGNLYALLGIYDLKQNINDHDFQLSFQYILNNLSEWTSFGWSYYDIEYKVHATLFYHKIHIDLLMVLGCLTHNEILKSHACGFYNEYCSFSNRDHAKLMRYYRMWRINGFKELRKRKKLRDEWNEDV